jgi:FMN phosphatase YigB (HAD superfamily)
MKKIIFFDGDGTLWYPKDTKWSTQPHDKYNQPNYRDQDFALHFVPTPNSLETLAQLKEKGIKLVLVSTTPHEDSETARQEKIMKATSLGFDTVLDEMLFAPNHREGKGEVIERVLAERHIPKSDALLVGDLYNWDYKPAKGIGVDALLLSTTYQKDYALDHGVQESEFIETIADLLHYCTTAE